MRQCDELKETVQSFLNIKKYFDENKETKGWAACHVNGFRMRFGVYLTPASLDAIVASLKAEIDKLEETDI